MLRNDILRSEDSQDHYLTRAVKVISSWKWLHDFKLTRFYADKIYEKMPLAWLGSLSIMTDQQLFLLLEHLDKQLPLRETFSALPDCLLKFLEDTNALSFGRNLEEIAAELSTAERIHFGFPREEAGEACKFQECDVPRHLTYGMSPKKLHEVSRMAVIVNQICRQNNLHCVVDLGAGMGYLDCVLCDVYGLDVIAVECDFVRTESAAKRALKHTRKRPLRGHLYHHTMKIDANDNCVADLLAILEECGAERICLVGLHCCGDFTPTFLDLFAKVTPARAMLCVGCCYHLMQYDKTSGCVQNCPLSSKGRKIWNDVWTSEELLMNVASLRLATQETRVRWLDDLETHAHCHSFRAVLELAAEKDGFRIHKKRRHASPDEYGLDFEAFVRSAFKNYRLDGCTDEVSFAETLRQCYDAYHIPYYGSLRIFRILQGLLQGVLETLITVDRLMFMKQDCSISTCCILPLFDQALSPRNLALVGIK